GNAVEHKNWINKRYACQVLRTMLRQICGQPPADRKPNYVELVFRHCLQGFMKPCRLIGAVHYWAPLHTHSWFPKQINQINIAYLKQRWKIVRPYRGPGGPARQKYQRNIIRLPALELIHSDETKTSVYIEGPVWHG